MPFDRTNLLSQAGYEPGDQVIAGTFVTNSNRSPSTSSTSYSRAPDAGQHIIQWDELVPAGSPIQVKQTARLSPGTDETVFSKFRSQTDGEDLGIEVAASATRDISSGWVEYQPSSPASPARVTVEIKTEPGLNGSTVAGPILQVASQL
jgi:hypothetical protein